MFDVFFGWRKASKCKKLIKKIQCRLKLLKNKRNTIVRQLKDDLSELLKHGHDQTAFDRVEQLYRDEKLVEVYDLLENFCEFILINLPYIRRNKDCPNDINEAMSSLIFASARFGDLPELLEIRKLFQDRYGQRFAKVALELLPGNLVNRQIQEKLSIKSVANDVKGRMLVEIARGILKSGPLMIEYSSEMQQQKHLGNKSSDDPNIIETEKEVLYVDFQPRNSKKFFKDLFPYFLSSKAIFPSKCSSAIKTAEPFAFSGLESLDERGLEHVSSFSGLESLDKRGLEHVSSAGSSPEISPKLPKETIYLDDIQEFKSPVRKDQGSIVDQRLFMFKPSLLPLIDEDQEQKRASYHEKTSSESFRKKSKKSYAKRLRKRSVSIDITTIKDVECAIYYGDDVTSNYYNKKYRDKRKNHHHHRVREYPCYLCTYDETNNDDHDWHQNRDNRESEGVMIQPQTRKKNCYYSRARAMTMPIQRPNGRISSENVHRSNSFPVEESERCNSNRHVHPKLPDYDELAAKFLALKKANLQM